MIRCLGVFGRQTLSSIATLSICLMVTLAFDLVSTCTKDEIFISRHDLFDLTCCRCNVASLLMVAFQAKMEYATE